MSALDEQILKAAKEIAVKFIETGRVSPSGFAEMFKTVYSAIEDTVKNTPHSSENQHGQS